MEKEELWFNDSTKEKAAFDFFWQQVSSLHVLPSSDKKKMKKSLVENTKATGNKQKEDASYFAGEKDLLSFVSPLSLKRHYGQGMIIANYKIVIRANGKRDLVYSEFRVTPSQKNILDEFENRLITGKDTTVFLKDCDTISFEYLMKEEDDNGEDIKPSIRDADNKEGKDLRWKEEIKGKVPQAIKLIVSKYGDLQEIISPIMVMY